MGLTQPAPEPMPDSPPSATLAGFKKGRVPRHLREQQMLDAAETVFSEFGYDAASIEEICRRAEIKRPLFYSYFGSKEGVYLACYERARSALDERINAAALALQDGAVLDRSGVRAFNLAMTRAYFEFLAETPTRWDMLYGPGAARSGEVGARVAALREETIGLLAGAIRSFVPPGVDEETILAFAHAGSGAAEQMARWLRRSPEIPADRVAELAAAYTWAGLSQLLPDS